MKNKLAIITLSLFLLLGNVLAQVAESSFAGAPAGSEDLDLNAVAEVFKESDDLAGFEETLNEAEGINNIDLDENGEVDYLRVVENVEGETHLIVLQSVLGEDQFQDVAVIGVEKEVKNYNFQIQGTPTLYGENYYVVSGSNRMGAWKIFNWMFRPNYRPYRSGYGWRTYPRGWRVRRPVTPVIYRTRTVSFIGKKNFTRSRTLRVKTIKKVKYKPQTSTLVRKKKVVRTNGNRTVVKKKGVKKTTNNKTGKTTVTKGKKKTVKTKKGKKTTIKKTKKRKKN